MFSKILIAAFTFGAACLAFWMAARLRRDARQSHNWPTVQGRILKRGIQMMQTDARAFTPAIEYAYNVGGKDYSGTQVYRTGSVGKMKSAAQKFVDRLPEAIPVHYNPANPTEAFLLSVPSAYYWLTLCIGIGAALWTLLQVLVLLV